MSRLPLKKDIGFDLSSAGSISRFFFAISLSLSAIITNSFLFLGMLFVLSIVIVYVWKGEIRGALRMELIGLPLAGFVFLLHLFTHSGEPLFSIGFLKATAAGAITGARYGVKLLIYALAGYLILATVEPFGLITPLERLARKIGRSGRIISALAIAFFLALRFLPELTLQSKVTARALKSRGVEFSGNIFKRVRAMLLMVAPLFVNAFKRADLAALALNVKGYSTRYKRAAFAPARIIPASGVVCCISILLLVVAWKV